MQRLGIPFEIHLPDVDESPAENENAETLVSRLAENKARDVAGRFPGSVVIGSDQVAACEGAIIGKPGDAQGAVRQLQQFSGRTVCFLTAVCVLGDAAQREVRRTVATDVRFRQLEIGEIERYVALDRPWDCAGSFKSESAGISLLSAMTSDDPTAIIGLPLIAVSEALRKAGFNVP